MSLTSKEKTVQQLAEAVGGEVTPRTIRYYIAEGLLPKPDERGRFTPRHEDRLRLILRYKAAFLPLEKIREQMSALSDDEVRLLLEQEAKQEGGGEAAMLLPPTPPPAAALAPAVPSAFLHDDRQEAPAATEAQQSAPAAPPRLSSAAEYTARLLAAQKRQGFTQEPKARQQQSPPPQEPQRAGNKQEESAKETATGLKVPAFLRRARLGQDKEERETHDEAAAAGANLWERIAIIPGVVEVHVRTGLAPALRQRIDRAIEALRSRLS